MPAGSNRSSVPDARKAFKNLAAALTAWPPLPAACTVARPSANRLAETYHRRLAKRSSSKAATWDWFGTLRRPRN